MMGCAVLKGRQRLALLDLSYVGGLFLAGRFVANLLESEGKSLKNITYLGREADCLARRQLEERRILLYAVTRGLGFVRRQFFLNIWLEIGDASTICMQPAREGVSDASKKCMRHATSVGTSPCGDLLRNSGKQQYL